MAVLPPDLAANAVQGRFEAKPGIDTYHQEIEHIGKGDPIFHLQFPFPACDVGIGPHHCEQDNDSRQTELQVPFAIDQESFGDEGRDRHNDDGRHSREDVVLDGINTKKSRTYQLTSQLRTHRTFNAETLLIKNCRDERIEPRCQTRGCQSVPALSYALPLRRDALLHAKLNSDELSDRIYSDRNRAESEKRD